MRVQFDLRPVEMVEKVRKQRSFNPLRMLAIILIALFFLTSAWCLFQLFVTRARLQDEVTQKEDLIASAEMEKTILERQVNDLRARQKVFADTLTIMQEDLPSIEVFRALETTMDLWGMKLNSVRFVTGRPDNQGVRSPNVVEVMGSAASDRQLVDFSRRLEDLEPKVFDNITMPNTTLDDRSGMISFTLRMAVRAIGDIEYEE